MVLIINNKKDILECYTGTNSEYPEGGVPDVKIKRDYDIYRLSDDSSLAAKISDDVKYYECMRTVPGFAIEELNKYGMTQ